jgi:hypothetical protein
MPSGDDLSHRHPLVSALTPGDDSAPAESVVFTGFHDVIAREGFVRLYMTLELSEWLDIPRDAVLQFQAGDSDDLTAPTVLWVTAGANVEYGFREPPEQFLSGDLLQQVLKDTPGVTAGALGVGGSAGCITTPHVPSPLTPITPITTPLTWGYTTPRTPTTTKC